MHGLKALTHRSHVCQKLKGAVLVLGSTKQITNQNCGKLRALLYYNTTISLCTYKLVRRCQTKPAYRRQCRLYKIRDFPIVPWIRSDRASFSRSLTVASSSAIFLSYAIFSSFLNWGSTWWPWEWYELWRTALGCNDVTRGLTWILDIKFVMFFFGRGDAFKGFLRRINYYSLSPFWAVNGHGNA